MSGPSTARDVSPPAPAWRRWLPLAVLALAIGLAWALGLHRFLSLDALAERRSALSGFVAANGALAALAYVALYTGVVALSLPGGAVMTLAGGLLFGAAWGTALAVVGATLGACVIFLAARAALGGALERRGGEGLRRAVAAIREGGFWYLLTLRLLPVVPFWLANLAPALAGMRFPPYLGATALGIVPGTAVFASIGAGLGGVLDAGGRPDLSVIFSPSILLPLVGLAALSLLGAWWRSRRADPEAHAGR